MLADVAELLENSHTNMNMKIEEYWPQHKVFFIATLSLFPERLNGAVVTEIFFKPYFASDDVNVIELTLQQYQKDGLIKYKNKGEYAWQITHVDVLRATDELELYIEKWGRDHLRLLNITKPLAAARQLEMLDQALVVAYRSDPNKQLRITLENIYGVSNSDIYGTTYWELILSLALSEKPKARIIYIGYDRSMSGVYEEGAQPYADIEILDQNLLRSFELRSRGADALTDEDPEEPRYNGLLIARDSAVSYNGAKLVLTRQEVDVLRVLMRRPEELMTYDDFTDPSSNVFTGRALPDVHTTLSKLVSATRKKLDSAVGQNCISNTAKQGWTLKIKRTE